MPIFKRLTRHDDGQSIDVNMDLVMYVMQFEDFTALTFGSGLGFSVKETADEIALAPALRFNSGTVRI